MGIVYEGKRACIKSVYAVDKKRTIKSSSSFLHTSNVPNVIDC